MSALPCTLCRPGVPSVAERIVDRLGRRPEDEDDEENAHFVAFNWRWIEASDGEWLQRLEEYVKRALARLAGSDLSSQSMASSSLKIHALLFEPGLATLKQRAQQLAEAGQR